MKKVSANLSHTNSSNMLETQIPETTLQLIAFITKNYIKHLPKIWKSLLIKMIIIFLGIIVFNIYMVAHVNQGFNPNIPESSPLFNLINIGKNKPAFSLICFLIFYILSALYSQIKRNGIKKFVHDLLTIPVWIISCFSKTQFGFGAFFLSFAFISSSGILFKNSYLIIIGIFTLIMTFSQKDQSTTTFVSRVLWSDIQNIFRKSKEKQTLNPATVGVSLFAFLIGLILLLIVPDKSKTLYGIIVPIISIGLFIAVRFKLLNKKTALYFIVFGLSNLFYYLYTGRIYADDGGTDEYSGVWIEYPSSPGASDVIGSGVQPGALGGLGVLVSSINSVINSVINDLLKTQGTIPENAEIHIIILEPTAGSPADNPYTTYKGKNPCR